MGDSLSGIIELENNVEKKTKQLFGILKLVQEATCKYGDMAHYEEHSSRTEMTRVAQYKNFSFIYEEGEHYIYGEAYQISYKGETVFHLETSGQIHSLESLMSLLNEKRPDGEQFKIDVYKTGEWEKKLLGLANRDYQKIFASYYGRIKEAEAKEKAREKKERERYIAEEERKAQAQARAHRLGPYFS